MIRFETQPDRRRLTAAMRRVYRRGRLSYGICAVVLALLAVLDLVTEGRWWWAYLGGAILCAVLPWLIVWSTVRTGWKMYSLPITWTFTEEGLHLTNALSEGLIRWKALSGVEVMPDQLIFRINRLQFIPVPIAGLDTEERGRLFALLRGCGLLPGARPGPEGAPAGPAA